MNSIRTLTMTAIAALTFSLSAFAGDPNGTWKFKAEAAEGRSVESTLTLKWENNQLSGTIDNRAGKVPINNGTFANDQLTFTVNREIGRKLRKKKFTFNYSGKLEGDTIEGTIQTTGRDEKPISLPWHAQRMK
jgi:hypothetical protein